MSSTIRLVVSRGGVRIGSAVGRIASASEIFAASRAMSRVAASRQAAQASFVRSFMATSGDMKVAAAAKEETATASKAKAKKAAPKKTAAKKSATTTSATTATKKKATAKAAKGTATKKTKKATAAKPKKKKKALVRKVLTNEEKQKLAKKKETRQIRALRQAALLKGPEMLPSRSWILYVSEQSKGVKGKPGEDGRTGIRNKMIALSESFKTLSAEEKERLRQTAKENHEKNIAAYKEWLESHTPAAIFAANRARRRLARLAKEGKTWPLRGSLKKPIVDPRLPKRPAPLYAWYIENRWASGDYGHLSMVDGAKQIHEDWKNMSDAERENFAAQRKARREAYDKELAAALEQVSL